MGSKRLCVWGPAFKLDKDKFGSRRKLKFTGAGGKFSVRNVPPTVVLISTWLHLLHFWHLQAMRLSRCSSSAGRTSTSATRSSTRRSTSHAPKRTRRVVASFWQNFGKMLLVFGCIGTDFCKKICVLQHFSKSTRFSSWNFWNLAKFCKFCDICKIFAEFSQKLLIFQTDFWRKVWDCSGAKGCKSCRAWKMLSNAYFLAKFRFDTAENEPAKNLQNYRKMHFRKMHFRKMHFSKMDPTAGRRSVAEVPARGARADGARWGLEPQAARPGLRELLPFPNLQTPRFCVWWFSFFAFSQFLEFPHNANESLDIISTFFKISWLLHTSERICGMEHLPTCPKNYT